MKTKYLVELKNKVDAGFDVCLAIVSLDLPLDVITHDSQTQKKCMSLQDFGTAHIHDFSALNSKALAALKEEARFFLSF